MLEDLCYQNVNHNGCIVLAGFKNSEVKNYSEKVGIPVLDGNLDPLSEPLVISDLEQAKGYEFDTVVIVNCEKGVLPADGIPEDEVYRSACQFYVSMTRAKNDLYLSYHKNPSQWLENTIHLYRTDWSEIESLSGVNLLEIPARLPETQYSDTNQDLYSDMTGLDFIYSEYAIGMTVEQQDRLINLVDGKGLFSSEKRARIKWKDMRSLLNDIKHDANSRMAIGQALLKTLSKL